MSLIRRSVSHDLHFGSRGTLSAIKTLEKRSVRRLNAMAVIGALALASVVVSGEQAVATPVDCYPTTPSDTRPSEVKLPNEIGGVYQITEAKELLWLSWATNVSNSDAATRDAARLMSYLQTTDLNLGGCKFPPIANVIVFNNESSFSTQKGFGGTYDGGEHDISGLVVDFSSAGGAGLFAIVVSTATIKNVRLNGASVKGADNAGGLVGFSFGTIINSSSSGQITGAYSIGGLVGYGGGGGSMSNSFSSATVTGTDGWIGGLVGGSYGFEIDNSYATGSVTGIDYVGGLTGATYDEAGESAITDSYATGQVTGRDFVGGLVGENSSSTVIAKSYATGQVTGRNSVGGLVGRNVAEINRSYSSSSVTGSVANVGGLVGSNTSSGSIEYSYAAGNVIVETDYAAGGFVGFNQGDIHASYSIGSVTGPEGIGGFVGFQGNDKPGSITQSYSTGAVITPVDSDDFGGFAGVVRDDAILKANFWDTDTSGLTSSAGDSDANKLEGFSTADMKSIAIYTDASLGSDAWDIVAAENFSAPGFVTGPKGPAPGDGNIWGIGTSVNSGYPFLWWQTGTAFQATPASTATAPTTSTAPKLAATGVNAEWLLFAGFLSVLAGSGFLAVGRRKHS